MYFMALLHGVIDCCSKQGFESVIQWHHHYMRHIKYIYFKITRIIMIIGKRAATPILKERGVWVWRAGMKIESLGNTLIGWGLNKNTLVQFTWAKNFMHKTFPQIIILILKLFNLSSNYDFQFCKEMLTKMIIGLHFIEHYLSYSHFIAWVYMSDSFFTIN